MSRKKVVAAVVQAAPVEIVGNLVPFTSMDVVGKRVHVIPFEGHGTTLFGHADVQKGEIRYFAEQAVDQLKDTVVHEMLHHLSYTLNVGLKEHQTHVLAAGLFSVLRNNPEFIAWIMS